MVGQIYIPTQQLSTGIVKPPTLAEQRLAKLSPQELQQLAQQQAKQQAISESQKLLSKKRNELNSKLTQLQQKHAADQKALIDPVTGNYDNQLMKNINQTYIQQRDAVQSQLAQLSVVSSDAYVTEQQLKDLEQSILKAQEVSTRREGTWRSRIEQQKLAEQQAQIEKTTVYINGQGYSIKVEDKQTFINQMKSLPTKGSFYNQPVIDLTKPGSFQAYVDKYGREPAVRLPEMIEKPLETGTLFYNQDKGYYPPTQITPKTKGEPPGFFETVGGTTTNILNRSLGIDRSYSETQLFQKDLITGEYKYQDPSANLQRDRIIKEIAPTSYFERDAAMIIANINNKYQQEIIQRASNISTQKELDLIIEEVRKKAEKESRQQLNDLEKEYQGQYDKREKERVDTFVRKDFSENFWKRRVRDVLYAGLYSVPGLGQTLLVGDIMEAPSTISNLIQYTREYPDIAPGEVVSSILTFGATGVGIGKLKGSLTNSLSEVKSASIKYKTIKPEISVSAIIDSAIKKGKNKWEINGVVETKIIDPKTGKILEVIKSNSFTESITSITREGAIKTISTTINQSLRKAGVRKYTTEPKITIKQQIGKSVSEYTFEESQLKPGVIVGKGESAIKDYGVFRAKVEPGKISARLTKKMAQAESSALTQTITKEYGTPKQTIREVKGVGLIGTESKTFSLFNTAITKEKLAVKGYGRTKPSVKRVSPYIRQYPKEQLPLTSFGEAISKSFIPEKAVIKLGNVFEQKPRANLPQKKLTKPSELISDIGGYTKETQSAGSKLLFNMKEKAIIETVAKAEAKAIAESQAPRTYKIKEKIQKPEELLAPPLEKSLINIKSGYFGKSAELLFQGQFSSNKQREKLLSKQKQSQALISGLTFDSKSISGVKQDTSLSLLPAQKLKSQQLLSLQTKTTPIIPVTPSFFFATEIKTPVPESNLRANPLKQQPRYVKQQGYDAYVLKDATKKNKRRYEKINNKPLTFNSAVSSMARVVDRTIAARGKVVKAKPKIIKGKTMQVSVLDTGDNYYNQNKYKFRNYATRKKKPLPTGVFIENQKYRLDSPGEVKKIQKERRRAGVRGFFGF